MLAATHEHIFQSTLHSLLHFILLKWARQVSIFKLRKPRLRFHSKSVAVADLGPHSPDSLTHAHLGKGRMNASLPSRRITQQPGISFLAAQLTHSGSFCYVDANIFAQPAEAGPRSDMPGPTSPSLPICASASQVLLMRREAMAESAGWSEAPVASVTPLTTLWRRWVCPIRLQTLLSSGPSGCPHSGLWGYSRL